MKKVELEYKTWWWPWPRHKRGRIPTSWEEMTLLQYLAVVMAVMGDVDMMKYHSMMFGLPEKLLLCLDEYQTYRLQKATEWMSEKMETSRMIIPSVEGLQAPEDALGGVTLQQFMTADTYFGYFADSIKNDMKDGDIGLLCHFVASLYMKSNEHYEVSSVRKTFFDLPGQDERLVDIAGNANMLERRADRVLLYGIYLNWLMVKAWLGRLFPLLFPEGDPDDKPQGHAKNAWLNTFYSFVGDDVAHLEEYKRLECMDAFRIMSNRIKDSYKKQSWKG